MDNIPESISNPIHSQSLFGYTDPFTTQIGQNNPTALTPQEIAFVDSQIGNYQSLIQGLNPNVQVVVLDNHQNGINQISNFLSTQNHQLNGIHIFSHGEVGTLELGNTFLNEGNLGSYQSSLATWGQSLKPGGDLLFYGCNVAEGTTGQAFLQDISKITGVDVAGSSDLTGNTALGGNWSLEYTTGSIETHTLSNTSYQGVLDSLGIDISGKLIYKGDKDSSTNVNFRLSSDKQHVIAQRISGTIDAGNKAIANDNNTEVTVALADITNGISIDVGEISTSQTPDPGTDTVEIKSLYTNGGDLSINGGPASTINIIGIVSTRKIASGGDPETSVSTGKSGAIHFDARTVNITNGKLLTNIIAPSGNNYQAGDININVEETWGTTLFGANYGNQATLNLTGATIKGSNVTFNAYTAFTPKDANVGEQILDFLDNFALFGGVAIAPVTSKITVDADSVITASNFTAKAQADGNATISTVSFKLNLRVSYGKVKSDASVIIGGTVNTTGNVEVQAISNNTIDVTADMTALDPSKDHSTLQKFGMGVAVSELYYNTVAQLTNTSNLQVGGNLNIQANTLNNSSTFARAALGKDGSIGVSTAVAIEDGTTNALLDGKVVDVNGNITINADYKKGPGIPKSGGLTTASGVSASSGTNKTSTGDVASDAIDTGILKSIEGAGALFGKIKQKLAKPKADAVAEQTKESSEATKTTKNTSSALDKVDAVFAVAVHIDTDTAIARIGSNAKVTSRTGAIDINSKVTSRPDISAGSGIDEFQPDPGANAGTAPSYGLSGAIAIGEYNKDAQAYIGSGSDVNANKNLTVTAQTLNEYEFQYGKNIYDAFTKNTDENGQTLTFGDKAKNVLNTFVGYLDDNLGLDTYVFDSWSQSTAAAGAETTLGGAVAVTVLQMSHNTKAYIGDNVKINQDASLRSGQQNVVVNAISINESVNFSGNIQFPGITGDATGKAPAKDWLQFSPGGAGTDNKNSLGASVAVFTYSNDVRANVSTGVSLYADSLEVNAKTQVLSVDVVASGGKSKEKGFNGAFCWTEVNNNTIAQIDGGSTLIIGSNLIDGTDKSLLVNAQDKMGIFSIIGGVAVSNSIGAGVSAGVNKVKRNTSAAIGKADNQPPDANTNITVSGNTAVTANNDGGIWAFSLAAAVVTQEPAPTSSPPAPSAPTSDPTSDQFDAGDQIKLVKPDDTSSEVPMEKVSTESTSTTTQTQTAQSNTTDSTGKGQQGKSGFAFAGDVAVNLIEDNVKAYINTAGKINTKQLSVTAVNDTDVISASGAAAFVTSSAQGTSAGIAGSFSYNKLTGVTEAFITGKNSVLNQTLSLTTTGLTLDAQRSGLLIAVTAGGSSAASKDGYAIAGSVSINSISNTTTSYITGIIGTTTAASVSATDKSSMWVVAGAAALGGKAGIGAAVAVNQISNITSSSIQDSTLIHSQGLSLSSSNDSNIQALSASLGVAKDKLGASGTVSVNRIGNRTTSKLVNFNNGLASTGAISLSAKDDSAIYSLSGAVGIGENTGIGAAAAYNAIGNNVTAYIQSSNIATTEGLTLTADSDADIKTLSAGVGGGKKFAFAGSLSINQIDNTVAAYIKDSGQNIANPSQSQAIKAGKAITLQASDNSIISTLSGGAAVALSGSAVGAAVSINAIGDNDDSSKGVKAYIDNADVRTTGNYNISLTATNNAEIGAIALGVAGGEEYALGGSVAVNDIESQSDAHISNNSTVATVGSISITSQDTSEIQALAGAVGISLNKSAVGAAISINDINNRTQAYIDLSQVNAGTSVTVDAKETATIQALTLAGTAADEFALGGSISINRIGNHTNAAIRNQSIVNAGTQVTVSSADNSTIQALAGAVGLSLSKSAVGASIVFNKIDNQTIATIDNAQIHSQSLSLTSNQAATIEAISAAGSAGNKAAISGAINLNFIDTVTKAQISNNAKVTTSGLVAITANDNSVIKSLAGQFALSGQAGVGVSVSTNFVNNQVIAAISNSQLTSTSGNVSLNAKLVAGVKNATIGASLGSKAGVGGSVSVNNINTVTDAHISDNSIVSAAQLVEVIASDVAKDVPATGDEEAFSGIQSLAGQISIGGKAGVGASVSTNNLNNQVKAFISSSQVTSSNNRLTVKADTSPSISNITVGGAGAGTFALGGSVTVNNIRTQVLAYISNNSTIKTQQNISISANNNSSISSLAGQVSAAGTAAVGAAVAVNNSSSNIKAYISDSSLTSSAGQVKVSANDTSTIKSLSAGASVAGEVAITGSVSVNNISNTIDAHTLSSTITAGSLEISANDDSTIKSLAGQISVGIGAAGVGAAVAYNNIGNTITAYAQGSTIKTNGNAIISADNTSDIETVAAGLAAGLYAGVGGSLAINQMNNNVSAYIQGGRLTAQGSVGVLANSVNTMNTYGGTVGAGLVGIGGTVVINNLENSTQAYINNSTVDAQGYQTLTVPKADGSNTTETISGLAVLALSKEKLGIGIGTVGGGAFGFAITASVNLFADNTQAYIQESAINVTYPSTNTEQSVYVKAFNDSTLNVKAGALGVGAAGVGAAIDVTIMKNATTAYISSGTSRVIVTALKDVVVEAQTQKNFDSTIVAGAAGSVGISGAISILNIDSGMSKDGQDAAADTQNVLDKNLSSANGMGNGNISTKNVSINSQPPVKGTTAFITTGTGGIVDVGGQIRIASQDTTKVDILAGAAAGGLLGLGGSVAIANVTQNSSAYVGTGSALRAFGNISIQANGLLDSNKVKSLAGAAGLVGIGAAVSYLTSKNNTNAYIGAGTTILKANTVNVIAGSSSGLEAEALGASVGAAAVGIVIANAEESGTTQAYVDNQVQIQDTNNLNVKAITKDAVSAVSQAAAGGIIAGSGTVPTATVSPTVNAYIGNGANIKLNQDLNVIADVTVDGDAEALGINIGAIAVGVSLSKVNSNPIINTYVGANTIISAANVTVESRLGKPIAISDNKFDPSVAVNNTADTITFSNDHGLQPGNQVTYSNGGGADIGGISNDKTYNVIAVDSKTVKFGSEFEGTVVNVQANTIKFSQNHNLSNGDKVIYETANGTAIGGLVSGNAYYVKVIDDQTVQLSQNQFVVSFTYKSDDLTNQITLTGHGFNTGDRIIYQTSGTALNGLESGKAYYVIKVDANNFRLASTVTNAQAGTAIDIGSNNDQHQLFQAPSQSVNLAGINTAMTINNHGWQNGDMVSYKRRTAEFRIVQDLPQNIPPASNVFNKDTDVISNDTFTSANHGFQTNDQVTYSTSGTALGNLTNNTTYYVIGVDNDRFQLSTTLNGAAIDITTAPKNSIHKITAVGLPGLQEGINYYVVNSTQNSFQLATAKGGAALTLDKSGLTGTGSVHLFNKDSVVDLTGTNTGKHNLHLDVDNSNATGSNHQLLASASMTIPSQGDGKFSAYAQAASGALIGVNATQATLNISPTMTTYIGSSTSITTTGNVTVKSLSVSEVTGSADSSVLGAIAVGAAKIDVNLTNTNSTYIGSFAQINAKGTVSITSQSDHTVNVSGYGGAGSLITFADSKASATLTHNTQTSINDSASIIAGNELLVQSSSNTNGNVKASADGIGLYGDADATTKFIINGTNQTNINSNAYLEARKLTVAATVDNLDVKARSEATGGGFIGNIDAHATVDLSNTKAVINLGANSSLISDFVNLSAKYQNVNSSSTTSATCFSLGGDTDSEVTNIIPLVATIWTDSTSKIKAYKLNVESDFANLTYKSHAYSMRVSIFDFGSDSTTKTFKPTPTIDFNSQVTLLTRKANPILIVNQAGQIQQKSDDITATITGTDVIVNDIDNTTVGEVNFIVPSRSTEMASNGKFVDKGVYTISDPAYDTVQIDNYSDKNLIINKVDVLNPGIIPQIKYNVNVNDKTITSTNPSLQLPLKVNPTVVTINNWGTSNLILQGLIDNPHDRTVLSSGGNIFSQGSTQKIITRDLKMTALNGSIGANGQRIAAQLIQGYNPVTANVPGSNISLSAVASNSNYLNLSAKSYNSNSVTVDVKQMTATTGEVNLAIGQTVNQTNTPISALYKFTDLLDVNQNIKTGTNIVIDAGTTTTNIDTKNIFFGTSNILNMTTGGFIKAENLASGKVNIQKAVSDKDSVRVSATDILLVNNALVKGTDVNLTAANLNLSNNVQVQATNNVNFSVSNNFQLNESATITATKNVTVQSYNNLGLIGATFTVDGLIYAQSLALLGGSNQNTFNIKQLVSTTTINTGGGNDTVNIGSSQSGYTGINQIKSSVSIYGGLATDNTNLNIDNSQDTSSSTGILTDTNLTGLGMAQGIYYNGFKFLNVKLGQGTNNFTILNTSAITNIDASKGTNNFRIGPNIDKNGNILDETLNGTKIPAINLLGTKNTTTIVSGNKNDTFQINRNTSQLNIKDQGGNNTFTVNTPINYSVLLPNAVVDLSQAYGISNVIINQSSLRESIVNNKSSINVVNSRLILLPPNSNPVINTVSTNTNGGSTFNLASLVNRNTSGSGTTIGSTSNLASLVNRNTSGSGTTIGSILNIPSLRKR